MKILEDPLWLTNARHPNPRPVGEGSGDGQSTTNFSSIQEGKHGKNSQSVSYKKAGNGIYLYGD
ncbi:hypothetical protein [Lelliottia aquatilis]|uniref:hypothetical protein n=1 Tax=Lelliottia aquatilis TaxID=2080838 RepID=UPI0013FE324A|nr:hypothetical protein [Lelliottia aquatilis]